MRLREAPSQQLDRNKQYDVRVMIPERITHGIGNLVRHLVVVIIVADRSKGLLVTPASATRSWITHLILQVYELTAPVPAMAFSSSSDIRHNV